MPSLSAARKANAAFSPSYTPVAVFVGGTSGIGQATAEAFARYTKGDAHIVIVGRNRAAAEATFATLPTTSKSKYEFLECDVSLMKNVGATTKALVSSLPHLNFLMISSGSLPAFGRNETAEGLPITLAMNYYSRWKFVHDLMPLLKNAKDSGEDAKVLSVLAAGKGGPIDLDDFLLEKKYSLPTAMVASSTYNDLMIEVSPYLFIY